MVSSRSDAPKYQYYVKYTGNALFSVDKERSNIHTTTVTWEAMRVSSGVSQIGESFAVCKQWLFQRCFLLESISLLMG